MTEIGRKIIVLGCPGSGKTTFSKKLHAATGLPLIHLDAIWWKPNRSHISREEFDARLDEALQRDAWIVDGDYSRTYEVRFKACDTLIFLDYSLEQCMEGIAERVGQERTDMPWTERQLNPELVEMVRRFAGENRPMIYSLSERYPGKLKFIFRSRAEANAWLRGIAGQL